MVGRAVNGPTAKHVPGVRCADSHPQDSICWYVVIHANDLWPRVVGVRHQLKFDARRLAALKPGQYSLVIEAVREVGGRELLKIPFAWPAKAPQTGKARGTSELGAITLNVKP